MKRFNIITNSTLAALIAAAAQLLTPGTGYAAGYKLADKIGASIAEFRDEILNVSKQVNATMAALDQVTQTAATDPRKAYKEFSKSVPRIDDAANKAKKRGEDIKARGQAYFQDWEKELGSLNNPEIRALAEERKVQLQASFDSIKVVMTPAREQFSAWLADLKDLDKYLGTDLTVAGVDAAKAQIEKTKTEGQAVQVSMDKVIAELNTIVATLTPARVTETAKTEKK